MLSEKNFFVKKISPKDSADVAAFCAEDTLMRLNFSAEGFSDMFLNIRYNVFTVLSGSPPIMPGCADSEAINFRMKVDGFFFGGKQCP